jgi:hypothetical protein
MHSSNLDMLYLLTYNLVKVMWKLVPVYRKNVLRLGYSDHNIAKTMILFFHRIHRYGLLS